MQRKSLMFVVLTITIVFIACTEQDPLSSEVTLIGLQQSQTQDVILANGKIVKQETAALNIIKGSNLSSTPLPALINFDDDVPGQTPMTGGANQPTHIVVKPSILLSSPTGIPQQSTESTPKTLRYSAWWFYIQ